MRDLRGITEASVSRRAYSLLFDWFYPQYFPVLIKGAAAWGDTPDVAHPLMRFASEFVYSSHGRIEFDFSSANGKPYQLFLLTLQGLLLFRDTSKLLVAYGSTLLAQSPVPADKIYTERYTYIIIILTLQDTKAYITLF
jgi:exportin-7